VTPVIAPEGGRIPARAWAVAAAAGLAVFAALGLGRYGYSAVLPTMQHQLGLSNTQAGALASWNLGAYVLVATVSGLVAARLGTRRVVAFGVLVTGLAMLGTGLVQSFAGASLARAFTGAGAGLVNVPSVALMAMWFSARRRGLATGLVISGSSLALVVAGPTIPWMLGRWGEDAWRLCWFLFGGLALLAALVAALVLRDRPAGTEAVASASERRGLADVLRARPLWWLAFVAGAWGFSYVIYITFFMKRLIGEVGLGVHTAGMLFMVMGWVSLACGVLWGHVSDVFGRKYALAAVCGIQAVAYVIFVTATGTPLLAASALLFGITAWSVPGVLGAACGDVFGPRVAGVSLGFVTLFLGVGQAVGPLVGGALADAFASFVPAYLVAAAVAAVGALGALLMPLSRVGGRARRTIATIGAPSGPKV
jgi:MFS family permease